MDTSPTKIDVAHMLVAYHTSNGAGVVRAIHYERQGGDGSDEPIKLLEVSTTTVPAGIIPIYFGPSHDVPFPVVIIEVTEEEFGRMPSDDLPLPKGWDDPTVLYPIAA